MLGVSEGSSVICLNEDKKKKKTAEKKSFAKQCDPSLLVAVGVLLVTERAFSGSTDTARRRVGTSGL